MMSIAYRWRGAFSNDEVNWPDAEAFEHRIFDEAEWNWERLVHEHGLGSTEDSRRRVLLFQLPFARVYHKDKSRRPGCLPYRERRENR